MEVVYITEENSKIHKIFDSLIVRQKSKKIASIPLVNLKSIILVGNIQITTQVIHMLMENGINVVYISYSGSLVGTLFSQKSGNIMLRIAQHKLWAEQDFRIKIAKNIVHSKLMNQINLLKSYIYNSGDNKALLEESSKKIKKYLKRINLSKSIQEIMGLEGICAKIYFESFNYILKAYEFKKRDRRPAHDIVNASLNYAYAFIRNEMTIRLNAYGFDTELGFMHGVRYGRDSLALDLMETFRPCFCDRFVLKLLNKKILKENNYQFSEEDGCTLTQEGVKIFCEQYQILLNKTIYENKTWFKIFDNEVKRFRKNILEHKSYYPFIYDEKERGAIEK